MTFIWLVIWLIANVPPVELWNGWAVALAVCMFVDVMGRRI